MSLKALLVIAAVSAAGASNPTHYGDPASGCESDEQAVRVQGLTGDFCSPQCSSAGFCPRDVPQKVTATPACVLQSPTGSKNCALECTPSGAADQCGAGQCQSIQGIGLCTYAAANTTSEATTLAVHQDDRHKFGEFVRQFGKTYGSVEEQLHRFAVFSRNLVDIEKLQAVEVGSATYSHLTPFADLAPEEFSTRLGLLPAGHDLSEFPLAEALDVTGLPTSLDWVALGAVNAVKNQGQCGSCWAFATVANIEGAGFVTNKKLMSFSEQDLVDCDKKTGDVGCGGGLPTNAFKDMIQNKFGLETEAAYPYTGTDGTCTAVAGKEQAFIKGFLAISTNEDQIAAALQKYGPLAIGINAGPMQAYSGGVAHPWSIFCNPKKLDHGVAIVGFGVDSGKSYWKIRNSWGPSWGEKGYYRIVRGVGACGLNTMVSTATGITFKGSDNIVV